MVWSRLPTASARSSLRLPAAAQPSDWPAGSTPLETLQRLPPLLTRLPGVGRSVRWRPSLRRSSLEPHRAKLRLLSIIRCLLWRPLRSVVLKEMFPDE